MRNSVVTGHVSFLPSRLAAADVPSFLQAFTFERVLGWRGLVDVQPAAVVNEVKDGVLHYELRDFEFGMQDLQAMAGVMTSQADYTGTGNFLVIDDVIYFAAETTIKADGVTEAKMPLKRAQGRVFGSATLNLTLAPHDLFNGVFSGSLQGTYADGVMSITGTARYRSPKLNGSITVLLAPRAVAWTEVYKQLPSGAPPITAGAALATGHVLVGWGTLNFHVNEWLTGNASVVLDPDGYITSHGILRPTVEYEFLNEPGKYEVNKLIAHESVSETFATALVANLNGALSVDIKAGGRIGPARLYGLEIEGQFSTRPGSVFEGRVTGRANLSAQASIGAKVEGSLNASLGPEAHVSVDVITVAVGITGQATLRAYVELQPTFERLAGSSADDDPKYKNQRQTDRRRRHRSGPRRLRALFHRSARPKDRSRQSAVPAGRRRHGGNVQPRPGLRRSD